MYSCNSKANVLFLINVKKQLFCLIFFCGNVILFSVFLMNRIYFKYIYIYIFFFIVLKYFFL